MKKNTILFIICCLLVCIGYIYLCFKPIIIHKPYVQYEFVADSLYNPIDTIDFMQGKNKIIIYTSAQDISFLPNKIKRWSLLECRDNKTIEKIKNNFIFERISNDITETTDFDSRIFFFKNNKLVFSDKFMIEESIFLRFNNTGWTLATNYHELINCFSEFRPVYFPIVK
ncbi:hypothetical protein [Dysgonomonas mossii]|uniref:hypothetical protein n=1 Tax=Dysgonomonas mossii TaxID=163665 RepID=UPI0039925318